MYRPAKPVDWCQCCQQGVALPNLECASDFFGNHNSSQIVHSSDNACCFHFVYLLLRYFTALPHPVVIARSVATWQSQVGSWFWRLPHQCAHWFAMTVVVDSPYNNFTNYAVSICKHTEIIPQDLLFQIVVI